MQHVSIQSSEIILVPLELYTTREHNYRKVLKLSRTDYTVVIGKTFAAVL